MGPLMIVLGLLPVWIAGGQLTRRILPGSDRLTRGLATATLAWGWLSLGTLGLGLLGWLGREPILIWSWIGLVVAILIRGPARPVPPGSSEDVGPRFDLAAIVAFGFTAWAGLVLFAPSLLFPVKVVSDGPIYHLYFAARWWKEGRIFLIATPFGENAAPYFPAIGDLWPTWLFVAWGGDRLARVDQVPFLILASATVFGLCRMAGSSRSASLVAACWSATVAPLMLFSFEPNVDTLFVAGYLLSVYFALASDRSADSSALLSLSGLAAGLAWGTKAPGIVFIPPLLLWIIVSLGLKPIPWRVRLARTMLLLVGGLAPEVFWLARNALLTGNPLYPLNLTIFGRTWLGGWYGAEAMPTSPYYLAATDWRSLVDLVILVFDLRQLPIWLVAMAGAWRIAAPPAGRDRVAWISAALACLNLGLFWLVIPYRTQQRFFLQAVGLIAVPLSRLFDRSRWLNGLGAGLLAIHLLTPTPWPLSWSSGRPPWDFSEFIPSATPSIIPLNSYLAGTTTGAGGGGFLAILIGMGCLGLAACLRLPGDRARRAGLGAGMALLGWGQMTLIAPSKQEETRTKQESPLWKFPMFRDYLAGWHDLELRTGHTARRIAYAGTNLPYYLMGPDFRHEVRYINVDAHPSWLLHDYHREAIRAGMPSTWPDTRPGWDRLQPDYGAWVDNLDREGIQLLVVTQANPAEGRLNPFDGENFPIERAWADAHPERFQRLYDDPKFRLYGVRPQGKSGR